MRRALAAAGPASPATAWRRYAEPALWAAWSPQITGVDASTPTIAAGTTGVVRGPAGLRVPFVVESVEDDDDAHRRWAWRVHPAALLAAELPRPLQRWGAMRLEHAVLARGTGCLTTLVVEGAAPVVAAYAPLAALALHRLVR